MKNKLAWIFFLGLVLCRGPEAFCQVNYSWGGGKTIVELDPTSDVPEEAFPFDKNFIFRKYLPLDEGIIETFSLAFVIDPLSTGTYLREALLHGGYDASGRQVAIFKNCVVRRSPGESKYPETHSSFDSFVPFLLSPKNLFKLEELYYLVYTKSLPKVDRDALSRCFIAMNNNGHALDAAGLATIKALNDKKIAHFDPIRINITDFEAFYNQIVRDALQTDMSAQMDLDSIVQKYSDLLVDQPTVKIGNRTVVMFLEYKIIENSVSTEPYKFGNRVGKWVQPDFGLVGYGFGGKGCLGVSPQFRGVMPYVGFNLLLRQYDTDVKFRKLPKGWVAPWQRLSIHAGLTLLTMAKDNQRKNLVGSFNPLVGVGYRLTTAIKLVGGVVFYQKIRYDQIFDETRTQTIGYLGISVDLKVREYLGDIGSFFTAK